MASFAGCTNTELGITWEITCYSKYCIAVFNQYLVFDAAKLLYDKLMATINEDMGTTMVYVEACIYVTSMYCLLLQWRYTLRIGRSIEEGMKQVLFIAVLTEFSRKSGLLPCCK